MSDEKTENRLENLFGLLGFNNEKSSYSSALIKALSSGINNVYSEIGKSRNGLFVTPTESTDLSPYLSLLNLKYTDDEKAKKDIIGRLSRRFGGFSLSGFESGIPSGVTYEKKGDTITFNLNGGKWEEIGVFIQNNVPPFMKVKCSENGLTWDIRDNNQQTFDDMDKRVCPFSLIDTY